jgi:hypothetical protein
MTDHLKHSAKAAVIAVALTAGYTTLASAHSVDACITDVYNFCGSDSACRHQGSVACLSHGHPGGSVPPPPDPANTFSTDPGWELNKSPKFKKR